MTKAGKPGRVKTYAQLRQQALAVTMRSMSGAIGGLQSAAQGLRQCILHTELDSDDQRQLLLKLQLEDTLAAARRLQADYKMLEEKNAVIKECNIEERIKKKKLPQSPPGQD